MKLQLFKNCKVDNIKRMSKFNSLSDQNAYYEGLITAGNGISVITTNYYKIGKPLVINLPYEDALIYNYGRFQKSDTGKWIYFSVTDFDVENTEKTKIYFSIDCWETARYQYGVTLGKGIVNRLTNRIYQKKQSIEPIKIINSTSDLHSSFGYGYAVVWYRVPVNNISYIITFDASGYETFNQLLQGNLKDFIDGAEPNGYNIGTYSDDNIVNVWICPFDIANSTSLCWVQGEIKHGTRTVWLKDTNTASAVIGTIFKTLSGTIETTDTKTMSITDCRGSIIWTCPYGKSITNGYLHIIFNICASSLNLICWISPNTSDSLKDYPDFSFTIPCERIDVFSDSYQSYYAVQREYDIKNRELTQEKEFYSSLANSYQSGIGGAIAGASSGGLIGAGAGAVAGVAGSILGAGVNLGINNIYNPKFQNLTDELYKRTKDELILNGDYGLIVAKNLNNVHILTETWSNEDITRFNEMVATIGYEVDYYNDVCDTYYNLGYIQGDFEIIGNIPDNWKGQIRERFNNGVTVV